MNISIAYRGILAVLLLWSLAACQVPGVRDDDATGDLGAIPQNRPGDIFAQMGREYMKKGKPAVALVKLKRGLELDPNNPQVHATLGLLYEQLGETSLAEHHYREATRFAPKDPYIHNALGSFLCQQGRYDEADEQFRLALRNPLYSQPWAANTNAGICALRAGHPEQAEKYLLTALSQEPRNPLALQKMARLNTEQGEFGDAKQYLVRYVQLAPHTPQTLLLGMQIEQGLGNADNVAQFLEILEQRFPDSPETRTARELSKP